MSLRDGADVVVGQRGDARGLAVSDAKQAVAVRAGPEYAGAVAKDVAHVNSAHAGQDLGSNDTVFEAEELGGCDTGAAVSVLVDGSEVRVVLRGEGEDADRGA